MKKFMIGVGVLIVLLLALVILLPFLIDLNKYQDRYRPMIEDALNRKVAITDIRLTIVPRLGVRLAGFTVMDDPAFGSTAFASLASLDIGIKLRPLWSGRVEVEEITLRDPYITVVKNPRGVLNISTLGAKGAVTPEAPEKPPAPAEGPLKILAMLAVDNVTLTGGRLTYEDQSPAQTAEYRVQNLAAHLESVRLGEIAHLNVSATIQPFNLPVTVNGTFGPLTDTLDFKNIAMAIGLGKIEVAVKGSAVRDALHLDITSPAINTADLPMSLPLTKPIEATNLVMAVDAKGPDVRLTNLSVSLFGGQVKALGGLTSDPKAPPFDGKATIQDMQLKPLIDAVTNKVSAGGLTAAQLDLKGRGFTRRHLTDALEGSGRIVVKDGTIEGVNLLQEAVSLLKAVGVTIDTTKATVFSSIDGNVGIKRGVITVERLTLDSHDFQGHVTGTVGFDQVLNLKVMLTLSDALSKQIAQGAPAARLAMTGGRMTVPMLITGSAQAPVYGLDSKAIGAKVQERVKEQVQETLDEMMKDGRIDVNKGKEALKNLFGR